MTASYLRRGMTEDATFSLFVRDLPPSRGFLVAAGLEDCLDYLETLAFEAEDLAWLRSHGFSAQDVERFASLRFTGDVHAVPEGRVVLAEEPLLEVTGPLPEAQLVETYLLNQITFQTAVATKALRCRLAAGDVPLVDFALRRTQGTDAGRGVARSSAIAGFAATSNVEAARRYGLRAAGTMAHSYVQAFPSEVEALRAFVEDFPDRATLLVDTYDTLEGVRRAVSLVHELRGEQRGPSRLAIRIDSGDLADLARKSRAILDGAGLHDVGIFVSGGLDEYDLEAMTQRRRAHRRGGHRHPDGRLGRRPLPRYRVQARVRGRTPGGEALERQGDAAGPQTGVAPLADRGGPPRRPLRRTPARHPFVRHRSAAGARHAGGRPDRTGRQPRGGAPPPRARRLGPTARRVPPPPTRPTTGGRLRAPPCPRPSRRRRRWWLAAEETEW